MLDGDIFRDNGVKSIIIQSCELSKTILTAFFNDVGDIYLRNRKRVACVYGVIMHAGNVRRIREKRVKHEA